MEQADFLASKMRELLNASPAEPLNMKTVIRQLNILTLYRPLSDKLWGLSLETTDKSKKFMLVNSNTSKGSQHFTIAHELYHLYFDQKPEPHFSGADTESNLSERSANRFASALLMPKSGLLNNIPTEEIQTSTISVDTAIRLEYLFGVSHKTLVVRLKELRLASQSCVDYLLSLSIKKEAWIRGYDKSLYEPGNNGIIIGDYGTLAKKLFDNEQISEGHYWELLSLIGHGES
ncbi:MAG: ImmA/IrrE family metallo-endopeptidase [Bacteroidales bacterium]|nr:ImmA/IrrE family metallo-endopeptidase [Bacteroidales bacterium]